MRVEKQWRMVQILRWDTQVGNQDGGSGFWLRLDQFLLMQQSSGWSVCLLLSSLPIQLKQTKKPRLYYIHLINWIVNLKAFYKENFRDHFTGKFSKICKKEIISLFWKSRKHRKTYFPNKFYKANKTRLKEPSYQPIIPQVQKIKKTKSQTFWCLVQQVRHDSGCSFLEPGLGLSSALDSSFLHTCTTRGSKLGLKIVGSLAPVPEIWIEFKDPGYRLVLTSS